MKFIINKQSILKSLSTIEGIVSSREIRSHIGAVLIETTKTGLDLTATDLEMTLKTSVEANIIESGKILLPARKLSQTLREFRFENILFEVKDLNVHIRDGDGKGKTEIEIMGSVADEFPVKISQENQKFTTLPPSMMSEMIDMCLYAVAEEDSRFAFNGLFVEHNDSSLVVVGTDGRRLSFVTRKIDTPVDTDGGIIIPFKTVRELRKLIAMSDSFAIAIDQEDNSVHFQLKDVIFISRLIDSKFPDYQQVIPKKSDYVVKLNREDFRSAIKQAFVLAAEPSRQIKLMFEKNELQIVAATPEVGRVEDSIDCDFSGTPFAIAFNSNFLLDVINVMKSEEIEFHVTSSSAPAMIMDPADKDFKAVVMSMRL